MSGGPQLSPPFPRFWFPDSVSQVWNPAFNVTPAELITAWVRKQSVDIFYCIQYLKVSEEGVWTKTNFWTWKHWDNCENRNKFWTTEHVRVFLDFDTCIEFDLDGFCYNWHLIWSAFVTQPAYSGIWCFAGKITKVKLEFFSATPQVCDMCQMKGKHNVFQNNDWLHTMVMCQSAGECKLCFIYTILYLHWLWNTSWGELTDDILQNLMIFLHCSIGPICSIGSIGSVDLVGSIAVEFELHPL